MQFYQFRRSEIRALNRASLPSLLAVTPSHPDYKAVREFLAYARYVPSILSKAVGGLDDEGRFVTYMADESFSDDIWNMLHSECDDSVCLIDTLMAIYES